MAHGPTTPRVLLVYPQPATFIDDDAEILGRIAVVERLECPGRPALRDARRAVARADVVVGWFCSIAHLTCLLAARSQGKRGLTILSGTDVARVPEIGYGDARTLKGRMRVRLIALLSSAMLPTSDATRRELLQLARFARGRTEVTFPGIADPLEGAPAPPPEARTDVLTVGAVKEGNLLRKGLLPFARASRAWPEHPFVIAGPILEASAAADLRRAGSDRLVLTGRLDREALVRQYLAARVYVQASRHEGFGISLAEAMMCGAAAVVTRHGALPEVAPPEVAVTVSDLQPGSLADAIRQAWDSGLGAKGRAHVRERFPVEKRAAQLTRHLRRTLDPNTLG